MIKRLEGDSRVQVAGMVARYFRFDPKVMLDDDHFGWAVRVAAFNYASEQERKAAEANRPSRR